MAHEAELALARTFPEIVPSMGNLFAVQLRVASAVNPLDLPKHWPTEVSPLPAGLRHHGGESPASGQSPSSPTTKCGRVLPPHRACAEGGLVGIRCSGLWLG